MSSDRKAARLVWWILGAAAVGLVSGTTVAITGALAGTDLANTDFPGILKIIGTGLIYPGLFTIPIAMAEFAACGALAAFAMIVVAPQSARQRAVVVRAVVGTVIICLPLTGQRPDSDAVALWCVYALVCFVLAGVVSSRDALAQRQVDSGTVLKPASHHQ